METLRLDHVCKVYKGKKRKDQDLMAVNDFNLSIEDNEFIVFVGPSGCGKSTTLRMIAGLEDITSGDLYLDGERVNDVESNFRDIAMVFQNYALYPHMSAYKNMAFGLKNRHVPKEEIDRRIKEAAKILSIEDILDRKPGAMSGGQRQRVALGRAIVRTPKVFLLDEPLSNLDAKLRASTRVEISRLYEKLHTTFIYVTHDQVEAMTMGTRIVVMRKGVIQQIDTPSNLFDFPKNRFVAGFLGTPQMNFFEANLTYVSKHVNIDFGSFSMKLKKEDLREIDHNYLDGNTHKAIIGIRPDDISIKEKGMFKAKVGIKEILGNETLLYCNLNLEEEGSLRDSPTSIVIKSDRSESISNGDTIDIDFNIHKLHIFEDNEGEKSIMITPRASLNKINGYVSVEGNKLFFIFNPHLKICLDDIDVSTLNEQYLDSIHRATLEFNKDAISLGQNGIKGKVKGKGMLNDNKYSRIELDDLNSSFYDDVTCIYLKDAKLKEGQEVYLNIDSSKISLIGEDHVSIFDKNTKQITLEKYQIKSN